MDTSTTLTLPIVTVATEYKDRAGKPVTAISGKEPFTLYVTARLPPGSSASLASAKLIKLPFTRIPFGARPTVVSQSYDINSAIEFDMDLDTPALYDQFVAFEKGLHKQATAILSKLYSGPIAPKLTVKAPTTLKDGREVNPRISVRIKGWGNRMVVGPVRTINGVDYPSDPTWNAVAPSTIMPETATIFYKRVTTDKHAKTENGRLLSPADIKPNVSSGTAHLYVSHLWTKVNKESVLQFGVTYAVQVLTLVNRIAQELNPDGLSFVEEEATGGAAGAPTFAAASRAHADEEGGEGISDPDTARDRVGHKRARRDEGGEAF
jgi:hypothetical protein